MASFVFKNSIKSARSLLQNNVVFNSLKNGKGKMDVVLENKNTVLTSTRFLPILAVYQPNYLFMRSYGTKQVKQHVERKYKSSSESDSDLEVLGHRGESEFWRRKMRTFHGILDVNKDGVISYDDFKLLADRFVNLGHLCETSSAEFQQCIKNLWEKQWGEITPYNLVTVEQYLEDMHHVLNDKELVKKAHSFLPFLFRAVDKNKSGQISIEDYKLFFNCLGLSEPDAILAFRAIDSNCDGKITIKEFVKHGRDYFLTEDENRISKYFWGPLVDH